MININLKSTDKGFFKYENKKSIEKVYDEIKNEEVNYTSESVINEVDFINGALYDLCNGSKELTFKDFLDINYNNSKLCLGRKYVFIKGINILNNMVHDYKKTKDLNSISSYKYELNSIKDLIDTGEAIYLSESINGTFLNTVKIDDLKDVTVNYAIILLYIALGFIATLKMLLILNQIRTNHND